MYKGIRELLLLFDLIEESENDMHTMPDYELDLTATENTYTWPAVAYDFDHITEMFELLSWLEENDHIEHKLAMHSNDHETALLQYMIFFPNQTDITYVLLKFPSHRNKVLKPNTIKYNNEVLQFIKV